MKNKREYNSERRRKQNMYQTILISIVIRENITPRGDGNSSSLIYFPTHKSIRENITPRGDGNYKGWNRTNKLGAT